jgi:hypothetical protein
MAKIWQFRARLIRRRRTLVESGVAIVFAMGAIAGMVACTTGPSSAPSAAASSENAASSAASRDGLAHAPVRDLRQDEAEGGHILRKHVGQTEAQLRERLERDRGITGASTYTDEATADRVVGATIAQYQSQIDGWLARERHPNLVLDYDGTSPIGRSMNRGEFHSHVCEHAIVVLKYGGPNRYYVLTSYPECRS